MKKTLTARKAGRHFADEQGNITRSEGGTHRSPVAPDKPAAKQSPKQDKVKEQGNDNKA